MVKKLSEIEQLEKEFQELVNSPKPTNQNPLERWRQHQIKQVQRTKEEEKELKRLEKQYQRQILNQKQIKSKKEFEERISNIESQLKRFEKQIELSKTVTANANYEFKKLNKKFNKVKTLKLKDWQHVNYKRIDGTILNNGILKAIYELVEPIEVIPDHIKLITNLLFNTTEADKNVAKANRSHHVYLKAVFSNSFGSDQSQMRLNNEEITKDRINEHLTRMTSKNFNTLDYFLFLTSWEVLIYKKSSRGGCDSVKNCSAVKERLLIKKNKQCKQYTEMKLITFNSKNNNCVFMPFFDICQIKNVKQKKQICEDLRKLIDASKKEMINIDKLPTIAKWFCENYKEHIIGFMCVDCDGNILSSDHYDFVDENKLLYLCLKGDHYYRALMKRTCVDCGSTYYNVHNCNIKRASYNDYKIQKKKEFLKVKSIEDENEFNYFEHLITFDLETFPDPNNHNKHTIYAVGWRHKGIYQKAYGKDCFESFISYIQKQENCIISAYNGATFDFYFLIERFSKMSDVKKEDILMNGSRVLTYKIGSNKTFDLCQFLNCSLADACKNFKTNYVKDSFDHDKIRSFDDAEKYKSEVLPYLEKDVLCLEELFLKFNKVFWDMSNINITNYVTLSHLAFAIWSSTLNDRVELPDFIKYKFIREAIYGGRCTPMKKEFKSSMYDEIINAIDKPEEERKQLYKKLKDSKDYIFNADVTSLYPSQMLNNKFPIGRSHWSENPKQDFEDGKIGIYKIKYECPKNIRVPILPKHGYQGGLTWDLVDSEGVYCSVDISNAIETGYKIEFLNDALVWDESSDVFHSYVAQFYKLKEQAEKDNNDVLRSVAKLLLNGLYGKTLQKAIFEESKICTNVAQVENFLYNKTNVTWTELSKDKYIFTGSVKDEYDVDTKITKPNQMGAFVLGYSRQIMMKYFKAVDPSLQSLVFTYGDTDSMRVFGGEHQKLRDMGYIVPKKAATLGLLTSDIDDEGLIIYEKNLGPKMYRYEYIDCNGNICIENKGKMKAKGIPKKAGLNYQWYDNECAQDTKFWGIKKKALKLTSKDKENNINHFSLIHITDNTRTFYKNKWDKMDLVDNSEWFPVGYQFN